MLLTVGVRLAILLGKLVGIILVTLLGKLAGMMLVKLPGKLSTIGIKEDPPTGITKLVALEIPGVNAMAVKAEYLVIFL